MRAPGTDQPLLPAALPGPPHQEHITPTTRAGAFSQSFVFSSSPSDSFLHPAASFGFFLKVIPEKGQTTSCVRGDLMHVVNKHQRE